jgi:hypothetical protein
MVKMTLDLLMFSSSPSVSSGMCKLNFLVIQDLPEVGTLSGRGKALTPIRSITDRHSLSPASFTRSSIGKPYG